MYFRLVSKLGQKQNPNFKWTVTAVITFHTAVEAYCITLFNSANLAAIHAHHVTVQPTDLTLAHTIHGKMDMLHRPIHSNPKKKQKAILTHHNHNQIIILKHQKTMVAMKTCLIMALIETTQITMAGMNMWVMMTRMKTSAAMVGIRIWVAMV